MLRSLLLATGILLCFSVTTSAKILRVGMDYSDLNSAVAAAAVGDTLQFYGTGFNGTIAKRLVLIGFGYNLDTHPGLQALASETPSAASITFAEGSDSCIIEGMEITAGLYSSKHTFRRCRVAVTLYNQTNSINNIKLIGCIFVNGGMYNNANPCTNFQMYNCILAGGVNFYHTGNTSNGSIINCVSMPNTIIGNGEYLNLGAAGFLVKNCILNIYSGNNTNTVYESNVFNSGQPSPLPQGSNNKWGYAAADIYNRLGGTNDNPSYYYNGGFDENYYILKAGSIAVNAGLDAANNPTDCGIFGGEPAYRYRTSGIAAVPSIYKLTAPSTGATTNPYNVTISVRSNN